MAMPAPMDNRRQSGLWAQNQSTGVYEQQQPGPYQYYQPPERQSTDGFEKPRRTFSQRAGNTTLTDTFTAAIQNRVSGAGSILDSKRVRDIAVATHAKVAQSVHAHSGDSKAEDFARAGHASAIHSPEATAPVSAGSRGVGRDYAENVALATHAKLAQGVHEHSGNATAEDFAQAGHAEPVQSAQAPTSRGVGAATRDALMLDPNAIPDNVRSKPWSPDPTSPTVAPLQQTKTRQSSNAGVDLARRGSVPDRSPLQRLEGELSSKEEKRARIEEAEYRARQKSIGSRNGDDLFRSTTLRSEKGRVVSDGSRRPSESSTDKYYRQVSAGLPQARPPESGGGRVRTAGTTLRNEYPEYPTRDLSGEPTRERSVRQPGTTLKNEYPEYPTRDLSGEPARERSVRQPSSIVNNPRPYHHAPPAPRSLAVANAQAGAPSEIARKAQPYHHAPEKPRDLDHAQYPHNAGRASMDSGARRSISGPPSARTPVADERDFSTGGGGGISRTATGASTDNASVRRSGSEKYKRRVRDAGFVGAAAAIAGAGAGATAYEASGADQGKQRYDNRRSQEQASPVSPVTPTSADLGRSGSRKLQKRVAPSQAWKEPERGSMDQQRDIRGSTDQQRGSLESSRRDKQMLQSDRMGSQKEDEGILPASHDPDPVPRARVATGPDVPVPYHIPPQTANGQMAKEQVGFDSDSMNNAQALTQDKHHHLGGLFHRHGNDGVKRPGVAQPPLDEWKNAKVLRLAEGDLEFDRDSSVAGAAKDDRNGAWWEKDRRRSSGSGAAPGMAAAQYDGPYEEDAKSFRPPLFLKCGPLLRYTGIRRETSSSTGREREIWRGSIMVVTEDENSDYSSAPALRVFAQPMDLHIPPPRHIVESGQELPPEFEDPVAGQVKISRTGRPLYVRPVHEIDGGVDLSREENNHGLYAATRTPLLGPQASTGPDGRQSQHITFQDKSRIKKRDGERHGRYREVRAVRLHSERGFTFWRWSIEIELGSTQHRVAYRVNRGPALGFWVPARGASMNIMFHSCNGFSMSVDPNQFSGPDPLWRDVLNRHQSRPFHVMLGGGDQIYNDAAMRDTVLFKEWLQTKNWEWKHHAEFTPEMQEELESFYFNRYSMWFSQGLFAMAGSQIPMVNLWDDHDIIDGFGSYPHHFMSTKVFTGLGAVAFKYYMLFQHQSVTAETTTNEPSWVLGASPGPYINELSRSVFLNLGNHVAFLGVDCRTERMRDEILSQESYDILFNRARSEIKKGETKHLIVLLGVPIAYPRLNFLENILTSRMMDPIKAIGRTGMLGGFVNKFDGGVEILDDLDDHWTAKHHKAERNWFIQELQELAAEKSVRVTILSGDVHLGAVGQFYTPRKAGVGKDRDHRYIPNIVSSAIVNTPPPPMMADVLNKRNKVHHLDSATDEDLIPMFEADVDGSKRNNKCLLPRRNYCTIREFAPGATPPPTPPPERNAGAPTNGDYDDEGYEKDRRFPPGSMGRTMSLTRGPAKLVRRLSGSSRSKNPPVSLGQQEPGVGRSNTVGASAPTSVRPTLDTTRRPSFHRRPTNMTEKEIRRAASKGGAPDEDGDGKGPGHIDLEGGLDISLNMEIDQHDPSGNTQSYRLLVPALWYEGAPDVNAARINTRGKSLMDRFRGRGKKDEEEDYSSGSDTDSPPPSRGHTDQYAAPNVQPVVARAGAVPQKPTYGADGAYDTAPHRSLDQPVSAYSKGYNLSPPLASTEQPRSAGASKMYPQSGSYRQASAPVSQKHTQQVPGPYGRGPDEYSEGSPSQSDDFDEAPAGRTPGTQPRRLSKAERFFGIGDEGGSGSGRRPSLPPPMQDDGGYASDRPERTKPKWMIWR